MQTIVYIDGFNLYYGACWSPGRKWLDLGALSSRLLPNDEIVEIAYCTANIKKDRGDPEKQDRQRLYHRALETIPRLQIYRGRYVPKVVSGSSAGERGEVRRSRQNRFRQMQLSSNFELNMWRNASFHRN